MFYNQSIHIISLISSFCLGVKFVLKMLRSSLSVSISNFSSFFLSLFLSFLNLLTNNSNENNNLTFKGSILLFSIKI